MKSYVSAIEHEIELQNKSNKLCLIRLEGINSPIIYKEVCKFLKNTLQNTGFIAKISKEKYEDFCGKNQEEWVKALEYLDYNDYVGVDGSMTAWRNNSSELLSEFNEKKTVVLLMGAEIVPDRGSLSDFYCINPDTILKGLKKDYSKWFIELFNDKGLDTDELKAIDTLFKIIFKNMNVDLIKLSNIIDELENKIIYTTDELIQEICFRLSTDWGIPSIRNPKKVPKCKKLLTGKVSSGDIISKSYDFINRQQYKNGLSKSKLDKIIKKIDEYSIEKVADINSPFPDEDPQFKSYYEFKETLINFIMGKDYEVIRRKLLNIDFSVVDEILNFKVITDGPVKKEKKNNVFGEPLEVYTEMFSKICIKYKNSYKEMPGEIRVKVNEIKISNCSTEEEKHNYFRNMCISLGGILEFINESKFIQNSDIRILYDEVYDPFNSDNRDRVSITKTSNINALSKIEFKFIAQDEDAQKHVSEEYSYIFEPNASWMQTFSLLNPIMELENFKVPMYGGCPQISEYISCESDEEFFIKLTKLKINFVYEDYFNVLSNTFSLPEITNALGLLVEGYNKFLDTLLNAGYFTTITNKNDCNKIFNRYHDLLKITKDNYCNLVSSQQEKIHMILNLFILSGSTYDNFINNNLDDVIIPPYNPVILEKIYHQKIFVRNGFDEILYSISNRDIYSNVAVEKRLSYFSKMSIITSGFDVLAVNKNNFVATKKMHHYYAIYNFRECRYDLISEKIFDNNLIDDDELDKRELIKKSHKSDILYKNIDDYVKTFPSSLDGLNILFINPDDLQHIVAGIHDLISNIVEKNGMARINIRIVVSDKRKNGADYLKYWLDTFLENQKNIYVKTYLNYMDFSSQKIRENIEQYIQKQDIIFVYRILENKEIEFAKCNSNNIYTDYKYPSIFKPLPISVSQNWRGIDISQRQFKCTDEHMQLLHRYVRPFETDGEYKVIKELSINETNKSLLEVIHKSCKWVICIDEAIDKEILNFEERKIIGFSTGQGTFGELNVTVSAREDIIGDIQQKLKHRLISKFSRWNSKRVEDAAKYCIELTKDLDGGRVLKALNPSDYEINNFLAYVLTVQNLHMNTNYDTHIIKTLINLDNHRHWFDSYLRDDNQLSNSRPDFLLLEIENNNENFDINSKLKIKATVIECKMAYENSAHIEKAKSQIIHGIKVLANNFDPNTSRVAKRYWFNQLYRALVFSKIKMEDNKEEYAILVDKLSNIYEGNFEIEWRGKIFAYWLSQDNSDYRIEDVEYDGDEFDFNVRDIKLYTAGQLFIQKLLVPNSDRNDKFEFNEIENIGMDDKFVQEIFNDKTEIEFEYQIITEQTEEVKNKEQDVNNERSDINNTVSDKVKELEDSVYGSTQNESSIKEEIVNKSNSEDKKEEKITIDNIPEKISEMKDARFLLGTDVKTNEKIYWEFGNPKLNNRHLLINGNSGSGKTYCIQALIMEAVKNNISVIVFDYTDGFTETKLDPALKRYLGDKLKERSAKYEKFPVDPFKRHKVIHGGKEFDEVDADIANRIASSFKSVYNFGPQQRNVIYEAVLDGLKTHGKMMSFKIMAELISESKNSSASTVYSKIRPFIDYDPFLTANEFSWKDIIDSKGELYIIQLSGFEREIQVMLTEIVLWDIWSYATKFGNESSPMPLVLDEAHNLSHDGTSPSGRILAEGRKFGLSGWYATQFMKGRMDSESIGNLQQAAQKLYFSPPEESIVEVARYIDITSDGSKEWAEKIKKLTKGKCVTCGFRMKNGKFDKYEPSIINITSLEERLND